MKHGTRMLIQAGSTSKHINFDEIENKKFTCLQQKRIIKLMGIQHGMRSLIFIKLMKSFALQISVLSFTIFAYHFLAWY